MFVKSGQPAISPFHRFLSSFFLQKLAISQSKQIGLGQRFG
jgi:hypothetical protein